MRSRTASFFSGFTRVLVNDRRHSIFSAASSSGRACTPTSCSQYCTPPDLWKRSTECIASRVVSSSSPSKRTTPKSKQLPISSGNTSHTASATSSGLSLCFSGAGANDCSMRSTFVDVYSFVFSGVNDRPLVGAITPPSPYSMKCSHEPVASLAGREASASSMSSNSRRSSASTLSFTGFRRDRLSNPTTGMSTWRKLK